MKLVSGKKKKVKQAPGYPSDVCILFKLLITPNQYQCTIASLFCFKILITRGFLGGSSNKPTGKAEGKNTENA